MRLWAILLMVVWIVIAVTSIDERLKKVEIWHCGMECGK